MLQIGEYYLADNATVLGDVRIQPGVNIWYGCTVRGDVAPLILGRNVNLQDGVIMHADFGFPNEIEEGVVVGHGAILHGQRIGKDTLIGMGATLLGGSTIGPESIIAAGALVLEGTGVPARSLVVGVPGRIIRQVTDEELQTTKKLNARYLSMAREHVAGRYPPVVPLLKQCS